MEYIRKNCRSWLAFVIPMPESTKQLDRSQQRSLLPRDADAINRTRSARSSLKISPKLSPKLARFA